MKSYAHARDRELALELHAALEALECIRVELVLTDEELTATNTIEAKVRTRLERLR